MENYLHVIGGKFKKTFGKAHHKDKAERKGATREFISKLSRGLMLPIAMLPIAGLFLGVGAAIVTNAGGNAGLEIFGNFLKIPGDVIFGALPVLFAIAIAIAFTGDAGPAALSAFVGYLVFGGIQSALISPVTAEITGTIGTNGSPLTEVIGYNLLFYLPGSLGEAKFGLPTSLFSSVLGLNQLSTSVFGGFIVGFLVAFIFNKFKNIQLPPVIGFFSGVRFIPVATFGILFPVTILVLMIWPLIGIAFNYIGIGLASAVGFNSFAFGYIERALVPFGLHHAFYSPLWYSSVGGSLSLSGAAITAEGIKLSLDGTTQATWGSIAQAIGGYKGTITGSIDGDQGIWAFTNSFLVGQKVQILGGGGAFHTIMFSDISSGSLPWQESVNNGISGVNIGQYMMGKYPFMMFGLPAAAFAMIMVVPKGNRKVAASIIVSAGFTSFLTGITEPLEFTFLFLAPWLFWGFHAIMCAFSFGLMNWIGLIVQATGAPELAPHIGMTFSGGMIDWIIYGGIQIPNGSNAWWALLIGLVYLPIYFFFFYWAIKKFNIQTPGRGENTKLFSKQDFLKKAQNSELNLNEDKLLALHVISAYGGIENIKNVDACITKLRIQVTNQSSVDCEKLTKELGAKGVIKPSPQSVYSVYGGMADILKNNIKDIMKDIADNPTMKEKYFSIIESNAEVNSTKQSQPMTQTSTEKVIIKAPVDGKIVLSENIPDETFSNEMLGTGLAINPSNGNFVAPVKGKMSLVFNTKHAYTFETAGGTQILLHIGIDSINLKTKDGKDANVFSTKLQTGDAIKLGDEVVKVKMNDIKALAKSSITPIIVLDESLKGREVKILKKNGDTVKKGDPIIEIVPLKN